MNADPRECIGIRGVSGVLPPATLTLKELAAQGRINSSPEDLASFGFRRVHLADPTHDAAWLAREAARGALADADCRPEDIDMLIWASALAHNHCCEGNAVTDAGKVLPLFRYRSGWLQDELGLDRAEVLAVAQQGCASMFTAIRLARASLLAEPEQDNVLCLGVDVLPAGATRELLYNAISDAACAVVVSRGCSRERWLGYRQISRGYYWDTPARQAEILAAYFPTSRLCITELLSRHGLQPSDIDWIVPSGVQRTSWDILLDLVGIPANRLYEGAGSFGHTISADNFLLLEHMRRQGTAPRGATLLLFTYGFGSNWCSLLLEH